MKSVLVTGNKGFIGRRLVEALKKLDYVVHTVDDEYLAESNWIELLFSKLDASNPDGVFHVGACSDTLQQNVQHMMVRNFETTKIISDWCFNNDRALIFSSSAANYGVNGVFPSNLYGWSKFVAEQYVSKNYGVSLRYFNVYGPGEHQKGSMSSFAYQAFVKESKKLDISLFPGSPKRDFIFVEDVVKANIHALNIYSEIKGGIFDVGTSTPKLFEEVLQIMGLSFNYMNEELVPDGYQYFTCADRKKWLPKWNPDFTLESGLSTYLEDLRK